MKLWIDDERPAPEGWYHARTALEAVELLFLYSFDEISFDHDLGQKVDADFVAQLIEVLTRRGVFDPIKWSVHSGNPVGARNIITAMTKVDEYQETKPWKSSSV